MKIFMKKNEFQVIDARSRDRFEGKVPEPRKGLRSGSYKKFFLFTILRIN